MNTPIISSDCENGPKEILGFGKNGILFKSNNKASLLDALLRFEKMDKKEIGDIADTILFDQNVQATWNRFKSKADLVLSQVKSDFGVTEYKLVLDETTTTPDLQDRNILYAKVFVKPARSIEFIAVDFVITQSGIEL